MKIAVIIASYNRPKLLQQTINSLIKNSDTKPIIVVVDDNSPDPEINDYLLELGSAITYFAFKDRVSIASVKNKGYELAMQFSPDYILFSDNDVYFEPHWDSKMVMVMQAKPDIGILGGYHHPHHQIDGAEMVGDVEIQYSNTQAGVSIFIRTKDYEKIGAWHSETIVMGEDTNFCEDALRVGFKIAAVTPPCILHCGATGSSGHQVADAPQIYQMARERTDIHVE